ncbi:threonine synthase [Salinarchaeum chitinilyticum]
MDAADGLSLACGDCAWRGDDIAHSRCPECDGQLAPQYHADAIDAEKLGAGDRIDSQWDSELLPDDVVAAATLGEGATPLVDCPTLADELEVGTLAIKDEGHNPTGTLADRACSVAVSIARETGAADVALPTTGADGVAAAAYAARADLDAHAFVPTRSTHTTKAMINVHGGDMSVVEGRLPDADDAFQSALAEEDWVAIDPANAPLRTAGVATAYPEIVATLDGATPDHVVVPTGHGEAIVGLHAAASLLADLGVVEEIPALHAVQAEGCAPIVDAAGTGADSVATWEAPDTICGALEVSAPALGDRALQAVRDTGGSAIAVDDEGILASACRIAAAEGLEASVAGGAAAAGAWELCIDGAFDLDDTVVLLNTGAGSLDSDVLRSHLMRAG